MDELESLKSLMVSAEAEERRLTAARDQLELEHANAKERVDLLRRLLGLAGGRAQPIENHGAIARAQGSEATKGAAATLENHIEAILAVAGTPVHIKKIRQALIDAGIPLPGRGDEANIIVRIARDADRFVRTGRGTYGLRAWGAPEVRPTRRRRLSRRAT